MKRSAIVYTQTGGIALIIHSISRKGDKLVIEGKALGTMHMDMILTLKEFFNVLKIAFSWGVISFVLLLPYLGLTSFFKHKNNLKGGTNEKI